MNEDQTDVGGPTPPSETADPAVEALRLEVEEHRDRYLRIAAELDNLRKRAARDVEAARKFGAERLAQAILPVRDSIEAGLVAAEKTGHAPLLEGQRGTLRLLDDALAGAGIREISPQQGQPFDPNRHEALSVLPASHVKPDSVLEVVQKGYEMNDRLLRAAKVLVSRADGA